MAKEYRVVCDETPNPFDPIRTSAKEARDSVDGWNSYGRCWHRVEVREVSEWRELKENE